MAIFGLIPWINPFGKRSIFRLCELVVFIAQEGVFSFQNIVKEIFIAYIALKKKSEKWPFFDQNHGLTPLEKSQFFDFLNFLFLQQRKACFRSKISQKTFFWPILPRKKKVGKISIFRLFELVVFITQKGVSSFQNILKDICLAYIA